MRALAFTALGALPSLAQENPGKGETAQIAEEAFIYGFPIVMNYDVFYDYFIDKSSSAYKAPINKLYNTARVYTPQDTTIVTPNSDTPYSFVAMDLRVEAYVFCNPEIEKSRYFSVQLIDLYTFNYGYIGRAAPRAMAPAAHDCRSELKGDKPEGISKVFQSETDFSIAAIRTQLFNAADIENVKKIQAGYRGLPLSKFLNKPSPAAPEIAWPKIDKQLADSDPFTYLNFLLQFAPPTGPAEVEAPLRTRFAKIGVETGKSFSVDKLTPDQKAELEAAVKSGLEKIKQKVATLGTDVNGWRVTLDGFGDRQAYAGEASPIPAPIATRSPSRTAGCRRSMRSGR
ncbi:MAG: DUF1254 domain-containing protein [Methyloceanibacter sp.]